MNSNKQGWRSRISTAFGLGLVLASWTAAADAAVISATPGIDFSSQPASIDLSGSSFIFTAVLNALAGDPPAAVTTTGTGMVSSFLGGVTDFGADSTIDQTGQLYIFSAFTSPAVIPSSAADDFIGLSFTLSDGVHYGYAEVAGTTLVAFGYETVANTSIQTGAIPEPATVTLLAAGIVGMTGLMRRRQRMSSGTRDPRGAVARG